VTPYPESARGYNAAKGGGPSPERLCLPHKGLNALERCLSCGFLVCALCHPRICPTCYADAHAEPDQRKDSVR